MHFNLSLREIKHISGNKKSTSIPFIINLNDKIL